MENVTLIATPDSDVPSGDVPYPDTLEGWQKLVGGYIEVVQISRERLLIVNEEGLLMNLSPNMVASLMAGRNIVGPAVVVEGDALKRWNKEA